MCRVAYMASGVSLPLLPWNEADPAFHVAELASDEDRKVVVQFSKPHVYYLGSHEGCGCGFPMEDEEKEEEERGKSQETLSRLVKYLEGALSHQDTVELYICWEGEQGDTPEFRDVVNLEDMKGPFGFKTIQFLKVTRASL